MSLSSLEGTATQSWLAIQCQTLSGVLAGVVWEVTPGQSVLTPLASWPAGSQLGQSLGLGVIVLVSLYCLYHGFLYGLWRLEPVLDRVAYV